MKELEGFLADPNDEGRYDLSVPFVYSGWKYFTDGKIAARILTKESDSISTSIPKEDGMLRVFSNFSSGKFIPWRPLSIELLLDKCEDCHGTGIELLGLEPGDTAEACYVCGGKKERDKTPSIKIENTFLSPAYLLKIQALQNVTFCIQGASQPLKFKFGEAGEGLLMPRTE